MKRLAPLALLSLFSLVATPLMATEETPGLTGCAAKRQVISTQLEQARPMATANNRRDWKKP